MEQELANIISQIGFPIVAFYLMYRMVNKQIRDNTNAINNNTIIMTALLEKITKKGDDSDSI